MILHNLVDLPRCTKDVSYRTEMNQDMRVVRQVEFKRSQALKYLSKLEVSKVRYVAIEACCVPILEAQVVTEDLKVIYPGSCTKCVLEIENSFGLDLHSNKHWMVEFV